MCFVTKIEDAGVRVRRDIGMHIGATLLQIKMEVERGPLKDYYPLY